MTNVNPTERAVRTLMAWHGDDGTTLARRLGVSRETVARRLSRGLTREQLVEIADLYEVDALELAMGRLPELAPPTRGYHDAMAGTP